MFCICEVLNIYYNLYLLVSQSVKICKLIDCVKAVKLMHLFKLIV